jgi:hypothetical protein
LKFVHVIPFDNSILSINRTGTINSAQYANAITGGKEELPHANQSEEVRMQSRQAPQIHRRPRLTPSTGNFNPLNGVSAHGLTS